MLVLLPHFLIGLGVSIGLCSAAGYSGALLVVMLIVLFLAGFIAALLLHLIVFLISSAVAAAWFQERTEPVPYFSALTAYGFGVIAAILRIRLHVSGTERLPEGRWLLVGNHRSAVDPMVTAWALRKYGIVFISKPENLNAPVIGPIGRAAGYLAIDRDNDRAALRTILDAAKLLKSGVCSIAVYPEGTRSHTAELLPFRNGVFKIAQKAHVPIVAAAIRGSEQVFRRFPWRATDVTLDICGVMDAERVAASKTQEIGETVQKWIIGSGNT